MTKVSDELEFDLDSLLSASLKSSAEIKGLEIVIGQQPGRTSVENSCDGENSLNNSIEKRYSDMSDPNIASIIFNKLNMSDSEKELDVNKENNISPIYNKRKTSVSLKTSVSSFNSEIEASN